MTAKKPKSDILSTLKNLDMRSRSLIIVGCCVVILILWFLIINSSHSSKAKSAKRQEEIAKQTLIGKYQYLAKLQQTKTVVEAMQKQIASMKAQLLTQSDTGRTLDLLTKLGNEQKLRFIYFRPSSIETDKKFYDYMIIRIAMVGTFPQIKQYFEKISKIDKIVTVKDMTLMRRKADDNILTINLELCIYYPKQENS